MGCVLLVACCVLFVDGHATNIQSWTRFPNFYVSMCEPFAHFDDLQERLLDHVAIGVVIYGQVRGILSAALPDGNLDAQLLEREKPHDR